MIGKVHVATGEIEEKLPKARSRMSTRKGRRARNEASNRFRQRALSASIF